MLHTKEIVLRDFKEADIETRIYWQTVETEWQLWDGPWEFEGLTGTERKNHLENFKASLVKRETYSGTDGERRKRFQIDTRGTNARYIGWVASYYINEHDVFTSRDTGRCAIGIDIPDMASRGKGYAYQALSLFINYLTEHGEQEICLQTWSGNERMVHIAEKIGFEECGRKKDLRLVRGKKYDALTFRLNRGKYADFCKRYMTDVY